MIDNQPTATIEITELPKNGRMITQQIQGTTRELKVGDFVSTEELSEF